MFHHRAGGLVEEFDDVQRAGNVFQVGLGEAVLAAFQGLHVGDGAVAAFGHIQSRGLVGIGAVTQIAVLHIGAVTDGDFFGIVPDIAGKIRVSG